MGSSPICLTIFKPATLLGGCTAGNATHRAESVEIQVNTFNMHGFTTKLIKIPVMADGVYHPNHGIIYKGMRVVGYDLFKHKFDSDGNLISSVKIKRVFTE